MAIHRKNTGRLTIPGPCFLCGKLMGVGGQSEDTIFWHGVTGGQQPFIRLHPNCARALAAGLQADLKRLERPFEEAEED